MEFLNKLKKQLLFIKILFKMVINELQKSMKQVILGDKSADILSVKPDSWNDESVVGLRRLSNGRVEFVSYVSDDVLRESQHLWYSRYNWFKTGLRWLAKESLFRKKIMYVILKIMPLRYQKYLREKNIYEWRAFTFRYELIKHLRSKGYKVEVEGEPENIAQINKEMFRKGKVVFLIGAGVSADSGIPTFRGKDGYWKKNSRNYFPEELATLRMFKKNPKLVWQWYFQRKSLIAESYPNLGHKSLAEISRKLGDRFMMISQNVDDLHRAAGVPESKYFDIHGNIKYVRCINERCSSAVLPFPDRITLFDGEMTQGDWDDLKCPKCGGWLRPHILWFDEYYDDRYYHYTNVINLAQDVDMLVIAGTQGNTGLPSSFIELVLSQGKANVIIVEPNENPLCDRILKSGGIVIKDTSTNALHKINELID